MSLQRHEQEQNESYFETCKEKFEQLRVEGVGQQRPNGIVLLEKIPTLIQQITQDLTDATTDEDDLNVCLRIQELNDLILYLDVLRDVLAD